MPARHITLACALAAALAGAAAPAATAATGASPPRDLALRSGWMVRDLATKAPEPQPPPPPEGAENGQAAAGAARVIRGRASQAGPWRPARVPSVFDADADPALYGGTAKEYRLRFRAPKAAGFSWAFRFEQARRRAVVYLNGRRIGISIDPYTPFTVPARGLRPGAVNTLSVIVDNRKDPRLLEGWWNWGGITRPVTLAPVGRASISDLGLMSDVTCKGPARACSAKLLLDGILARLPRERPTYRLVRRGRRLRRVALPLPQPRLTVRLKSPTGRVTRGSFALSGLRSARRRVQLEMKVPAPKLWDPQRPQLYDAQVALSYRGRRTQYDRRKIGLRSVAVKNGLLYLNNRRINVRGASIHEDFPGVGAATTGADMDATVRELKALGANMTRAHYLLSEGLLRRLDKAGIMVWSEAPVWQRDAGRNLLGLKAERARAYAQVERTVKAARNHPSVITHSIANELALNPDRKPFTSLYIRVAAEKARGLDPTLPISIAIKTRPTLTPQLSYGPIDMIGINQYFGWYPWVEDFNGLLPFLRQMRANYPDKALLMTEFGAEARPELADAPADMKGSYAFQAMHAQRTLNVVEQAPFLAGALYWTLREFEIFPGWGGGAPPQPGARNTRHYKGLLTYDGRRKPAWQVVRDEFVRTPLYPGALPARR